MTDCNCNNEIPNEEQTCPGPLMSRRSLIRGAMLGSLGLLLGRHVPAAWAADPYYDPLTGGTTAGGPDKRPAKGQMSYGIGKAKSVIVLWLAGGPSHIDTFDPKPESGNSGGVKAVKANADGMMLSEKLPLLAKHGKDLALLRGMNSKEGDHSSATYFLHTGYRRQGTVQLPSLGSIVCAETRTAPQGDLPSFVAINSAVEGAGFLGSQYNPFVVRNAGKPVQDLHPPRHVNRNAVDERRRLLDSLDKHFAKQTGAPLAVEHRAVYEKAVKLSRSPLSGLFNLENEDSKVIDKWGGEDNRFGKGCLVAKRLVEKGVRYVEVQHGGWDTHDNNNERTGELCRKLDTPFSRLLEELRVDGLLNSTLIVCMGEFGRTPKINGNGGRDHYPKAWSVALAGGGVKGGQVFGDTGKDGATVRDGMTTVPDLFNSISLAAGIDPKKVRESPEGRPIRTVDKSAKPIKGLFG